MIGFDAREPAPKIPHNGGDPPPGVVTAFGIPFFQTQEIPNLKIAVIAADLKRLVSRPGGVKELGPGFEIVGHGGGCSVGHGHGSFRGETSWGLARNTPIGTEKAGV